MYTWYTWYQMYHVYTLGRPLAENMCSWSSSIGLIDKALQDRPPRADSHPGHGLGHRVGWVG
jgi:hypothetical protein